MRALVPRHCDMVVLLRINQPGEAVLCLQSSTFPLHTSSFPDVVHYFPPLHMALERPVHTSSFFSIGPVKRYWMQRQLSWRFSPFCDWTKFFSSSIAPRGDASSIAALRFLTDQKASCSLYAQALCGTAPTLHSLLARRVSVEGAV